jgi:hypothetical protein
MTASLSVLPGTGCKTTLPPSTGSGSSGMRRPFSVIAHVIGASQDRQRSAIFAPLDQALDVAL